MVSSATRPPAGPITTPLTELLGIRHPIVLAGMAGVSGGALAAAVSNAGGLGVVGGFRLTPDQLRETVAELKAALADKTLPFGVDLALPQVGGSARATNHDYTDGRLDELIDIVIDEGARLFVSAVGVPPPHVITRLHAAGILVMNMVGHPRHATKALAAGVDLLCAQGTEGGGHTGPVAASVLVPAVVDVARAEGVKRGNTPLVLAAGGIADGRGLAAALMQGAAGVWVGTRFVASAEAGCSEAHKQAVVSCGPDDTDITLVLSGRPLRARLNDYIRRWHAQPDRLRDLCARGIVPVEHDLDHLDDADADFDIEMPYLMGQVAGNISRVQPAAEIVDDMVAGAVAQLQQASRYLGKL
ncbi:2-nitropropane dioxygenase [Grosmannia clavigera kw1407]|uniref:2-nitropropane dioxygenase n=1 Tax=Grosmannia clavigera (strain kw1407 / UAMH 11150) TaxID=655863 RepID=F0XRC8_GROCL|nr:2-nitropropane dioxygenase [Grosmannia clavigera kw1407]EFW99792.1 2-nitropropane dioxygenase [Grosmannia clavigera kw1407]